MNMKEVIIEVNTQKHSVQADAPPSRHSYRQCWNHHPGDDPLDWLRDSIPGEPGVDYPIFAEVQDTAFSCEGRKFGGKKVLTQPGSDLLLVKHSYATQYEDLMKSSYPLPLGRSNILLSTSYREPLQRSP